MGERVIRADVCVVGAGIVGLAHALEARSRGLEVAVLEREDRPAGASVRNFGHLFVSAMGDGIGLECALEARKRWLELGASAGCKPIGRGSLIVARDDDELEVLEAVASDPRRGTRLITTAQAQRLAPVACDGIVGALHGELDLRVDPRRATPALAALLEDDEGALVLWGANVHAIGPGRVDSTRATVRAPLVIVCPGPDYGALPPELIPRREGLTRCKLQMLRVGAPSGRRYGPALLTGLSLLRYPAFSEQPACERVRARIEQQRPELIEAGIHLIVTQLPDGDLIIGDTHEYGDTVSPFGDERLDRLVLEEACWLLGVPRLEVRERWQGVYPTAPGDPFMVELPFPGTAIVEVVSGVGMTTALGLAPRTLDAVTRSVSDRPATPSAPHRHAAARAGYGS